MKTNNQWTSWAQLTTPQLSSKSKKSKTRWKVLEKTSHLSRTALCPPRRSSPRFFPSVQTSTIKSPFWTSSSWIVLELPAKARTEAAAMISSLLLIVIKMTNWSDLSSFVITSRRTSFASESQSRMRTFWCRTSSRPCKRRRALCTGCSTTRSRRIRSVVRLLALPILHAEENANSAVRFWEEQGLLVAGCAWSHWLLFYYFCWV